MSRFVAAGLALPLLLSATVFAQETDHPAGLSPAQIYQQLTAQPTVPADAPKTLTELRERTGHSPQAIQRLLRLEAGPAVRLPWLTAEAVGQAQAQRVSSRNAAEPALVQRAALASRSSLQQAAELTRDCYRAGLRKLAAKVVAEHPRLSSWDALPEGVRLDCTYQSGNLRIRARRTVAGGPLAVALPPGLGAKVQGSPGAQDLALLEAGVLTLSAGQLEATLVLPVACAGYGYRGPSFGRTYALRSFPADGTTDRLLGRICQAPLADAAAQLAVWVADDGIASVRWSDTQTMRGAPVRPEHMEAAAHLLLEGGVDPRETRLFLAPEAPTGAQP